MISKPISPDSSGIEIDRQVTAAEQEVMIAKGQVSDAAIFMLDIGGFARFSAWVKKVCPMRDSDADS